MMRNFTKIGIVGGPIRRALMLGLCIAASGVVFYPGPAGIAFAGRFSINGDALEPVMQEKVRAALLKLKESPADIAAIEVLLSVEPQMVEFVGTNQYFSGTDPLRNEALQWCQTLQPAEVLVACLDKGADPAIHWALRQIVWRRGNGGFDEQSQSRLMLGLENALAKSTPATRAQAVRTLINCLPSERRLPFLQGLLKDQPDEVIAAAIEGLAPRHEINPEIEVIVSKWLKTTDNPVLLHACCSYWWLTKSRQSQLAVKVEEITTFERLAGHADATVRCSVTRALSGEVMAGQPGAVAILLRLTSDQDPLVQWQAVRSLCDANTPEVNARLHELFALDQPAELRAAAVEVLGVFGKSNLPLMVKAAKTDPEPGVRQNAVYALRMIGTPEAGAALEVAAKDSDANVQREAREQLTWYRKEHSQKP